MQQQQKIPILTELSFNSTLSMPKQGLIVLHIYAWHTLSGGFLCIHIAQICVSYISNSKCCMSVSQFNVMTWTKCTSLRGPH